MYTYLQVFMYTCFAGFWGFWVCKPFFLQQYCQPWFAQIPVQDPDGLCPGSQPVRARRLRHDCCGELHRRRAFPQNDPQRLLLLSPAWAKIRAPMFVRCCIWICMYAHTRVSVCVCVCLQIVLIQTWYRLSESNPNFKRHIHINLAACRSDFCMLRKHW